MVRSAKGQAGGRGRRRWDEAEPETGALIKRWIGATRRRTSRESRNAVGGAQIIALTWAQTFGRPPRESGSDAPRGNQGRMGETVVLRPRSCA